MVGNDTMGIHKQDKAPRLRSAFLNHDQLRRRLKKTLYYGKHPRTDRPSLPMTRILVNFFANCALRPDSELDPTRNKLDLDVDFGMDVAQFAEISREACISPHAIVMALIYVDRLMSTNPEFMLSIPSSHLFLLTTMVASKYLYDVEGTEGVYNDEWAKSGGLSVTELNRLELKFLEAIAWNCHVTDSEFQGALAKLERTVAYNQAESRGWFSVSELATLVNGTDLLEKFYGEFLRHLVKVLLVVMASYTFAALLMTSAMNVRYEVIEQTNGWPALTPYDIDMEAATATSGVLHGNKGIGKEKTVNWTAFCEIDRDRNTHFFRFARIEFETY